MPEWCSHGLALRACLAPILIFLLVLSPEVRATVPRARFYRFQRRYVPLGGTPTEELGDFSRRDCFEGDGDIGLLHLRAMRLVSVSVSAVIDATVV